MWSYCCFSVYFSYQLRTYPFHPNKKLWALEFFFNFGDKGSYILGGGENRPLSESLVKSSIESARPVCPPAGLGVQPTDLSEHIHISFSLATALMTLVTLQVFWCRFENSLRSWESVRAKVHILFTRWSHIRPLLDTCHTQIFLRLAIRCFSYEIGYLV